jgi:hypothetical protein
MIPNTIEFSSFIKLELHYFDLLWICCTTSCTANPHRIHNKLQKIHNFSTFLQVHNKSNEWSMAFDLSTTSRKTVQQIHNKSNKWSLSSTEMSFRISSTKLVEFTTHQMGRYIGNNIIIIEAHIRPYEIR